MGKYSLKNLRDIALEYGRVEHPDLASMARELGRVVHRGAPALSARLATLRRHRGRLALALAAVALDLAGAPAVVKLPMVALAAMN